MNRVMSGDLIFDIESIREIDRYTIEDVGIPGPVLMENAGRAVADEVTSLLDEDFLEPINSEIVIICGRGNNGGDGLVAARHLYNRGYKVRCFILAERNDLSGDAAVQSKIAENIGVDIRYSPSPSVVGKALKSAHAAVDAIFGSGLKREVRGAAAKIIEQLNKFPGFIVSVDIPSGLHGDTGEVLGTAVKADSTVTFGFPKKGFFMGDGPDLCGEVRVVDISLALPPHFRGPFIRLNNPSLLRGFIPKRKKASHKGTYGTLYTLCGSEKYSGAAVLCAQAAIRAGAGLVKMGADKKLHSLVKRHVREAVGDILPSIGEVGPSEMVSKILAGSKGASAFVIGSGLGDPSAWRPVLAELLPKIKVPVVLDADALNALGSDTVSVLKKSKSTFVLTPHPGEFARIKGIKTSELRFRRIEEASALAADSLAVVLLKGYFTVISSPTGDSWINISGNPGMATAGAGDVLAGMLGGYLAQGVDPVTAARAAAFIHGAAGDAAALTVGENALAAGDLLNFIIEVQKILIEV